MRARAYQGAERITVEQVPDTEIEAASGGARSAGHGNPGAAGRARRAQAPG